MRAGKAAWVAFGLSTALAGAAEAQEPSAQPGLAGVPIGAPATIRRIDLPEQVVGEMQAGGGGGHRPGLA
ncbi:hypothetical protein MPAR162_17480 [Methylorubrum populi]